MSITEDRSLRLQHIYTAKCRAVVKMPRSVSWLEYIFSLMDDSVYNGIGRGWVKTATQLCGCEETNLKNRALYSSW